MSDVDEGDSETVASYELRTVPGEIVHAIFEWKYAMKANLKLREEARYWLRNELGIDGDSTPVSKIVECGPVKNALQAEKAVESARLQLRKLVEEWKIKDDPAR